jgi:hypothetical protein
MCYHLSCREPTTSNSTIQLLAQPWPVRPRRTDTSYSPRAICVFAGASRLPCSSAAATAVCAAVRSEAVVNHEGGGADIGNAGDALQNRREPSKEGVAVVKKAPLG